MSEAYPGGFACGAIMKSPASRCGYAWDHLDPALPKFGKMPPT